MIFRRRTIVTCMYAGYIFIVTLYPFEVSPSPLQSFAVSEFFSGFGAADFVFNVGLFVPLGALVWCRLAPGYGHGRAIMAAAAGGAALSLVIEVLQVFFTRVPSVFDVLANMSGAGAGAMAASFCPWRLAAVARGLWNRLEKSGAVAGLALLFASVPLLLSVAQYAAPFGLWNPRFTFQLGNEATLNRPWLGQIYFVALYARALSESEIRSRYLQGPRDSFLPGGVVSLYTFSEGEGNIVHDSAGIEPALDLTLEPAGRVRWLESGNGVELVRPAILRSRKPARRLAGEFGSSGELTVEAWLSPSRGVQHGPARIVSFSHHPRTRNFMLGQKGAEFVFRIRTPITGLNGAPLDVATGDPISPARMVHLVATYGQGVEKLYVDGHLQTDILDLTKDSLIGLGTRKSMLARLAYGFVYFFTPGFFLARFLSDRMDARGRSLMVVMAAAGALLSVTAGFQAIAFRKAVDVPLIALGLLLAVCGALGGAKKPAAGKERLRAT